MKKLLGIVVLGYRITSNILATKEIKQEKKKCEQGKRK